MVGAIKDLTVNELAVEFNSTRFSVSDNLLSSVATLLMAMVYLPAAEADLPSYQGCLYLLRRDKGQTNLQRSAEPGEEMQ